MTGNQHSAAFEAAYAKAFPLSAGTLGKFARDAIIGYHDACVHAGWIMWQAATAEERERAANVCIDTAEAFKESKNHAIAFGAYRCSDKIRSGE